MKHYGAKPTVDGSCVSGKDQLVWPSPRHRAWLMMTALRPQILAFPGSGYVFQLTINSIQYGEGDKVDLECKSEGGHPTPNLEIRSNGNIALEVNTNLSAFYF